MRALGVGLIVVAVGASTALVSAGTVADDALYPVKITSEQVRLALATSPEDRAVVELSIAEHRLAEATALATLGDEDDAIVATSEYGEHMANAAAELAVVESLQPETAMLIVQLQQRIGEHRALAAAAVARLSADPTRSSAAAALAAVAAPGSASSEQRLHGFWIADVRGNGQHLSAIHRADGRRLLQLDQPPAGQRDRISV